MKLERFASVHVTSDGRPLLIELRFDSSVLVPALVTSHVWARGIEVSRASMSAICSLMCSLVR